jgi:lipoprotein-anchoring transpeptidase ErfK/SrfK
MLRFSQFRIAFAAAATGLPPRGTAFDAVRYRVTRGMDVGREAMSYAPRVCAALAAAAAVCLSGASAQGQSLALTESRGYPASIFRQVVPDRTPQQPWQDAAGADESDAVVPEHLRRQIVAYPTREAPGTIVIDTANTYLYYVQGGGRAIRYGIGVGREGFTWTGTRSIDRKVEWPDWHPPAEMIARQPYLPRFMAGGPGNPLGARAMYLGGTLYRIHGTNQPSSIGQKVSSGCIRLLNEDVIDLFNRTNLGSKVVVLPDGPRRAPAEVALAREPQAAHAYARASREEMPQPLASVPERGAYRHGSSAFRLY